MRNANKSPKIVYCGMVREVDHRSSSYDQYSYTSHKTNIDNRNKHTYESNVLRC